MEIFQAFKKLNSIWLSGFREKKRKGQLESSKTSFKAGRVLLKVRFYMIDNFMICPTIVNACNLGPHVRKSSHAHVLATASFEFMICHGAGEKKRELSTYFGHI